MSKIQVTGEHLTQQSTFWGVDAVSGPRNVCSPKKRTAGAVLSYHGSSVFRSHWISSAHSDTPESAIPLPLHTSYADPTKAQRFSRKKYKRDRETVRVRFRSGKAAYDRTAERGTEPFRRDSPPAAAPDTFPSARRARREARPKRRAGPDPQLSGGDPRRGPSPAASPGALAPGGSRRPSATALPLSPGPGPPAPPFVLTAPRTPRSTGAPGPAPAGMRSAAAPTRAVSQLRPRPPHPHPPRAAPGRRRDGGSAAGHSPLLTGALPGLSQRLGARHAAPPSARRTLLSLSVSLFPLRPTHGTLWSALSAGPGQAGPGRAAGLTAGDAARYARAERCGCGRPFVRGGADSCGRRCPAPRGASPQHPPARRWRLTAPARSSPPSLRPRSAIGGGRSSGRRPGNSSAAAARGAPTGSESPSRGTARGGAGAERAIRRGACGRRPRRDDGAVVGGAEEGKGTRRGRGGGSGTGSGCKAAGAEPLLRPPSLRAVGASRCLGPGVAEGGSGTARRWFGAWSRWALGSGR